MLGISATYSVIFIRIRALNSTKKVWSKHRGIDCESSVYLEYIYELKNEFVTNSLKYIFL